MDWISYINEDENKALEEIYRRYRTSLVLYFCKQHRLSQSEAIELFQIAVVLMYDQVVSRKTTEIRNLKNYLIAIAKYQVLARQRKMKWSSLEDWEWSAVSADESNGAINPDDIRQLNQHLMELGDPCSTLLELFYYKKRDYVEISETMGYRNVDAAKTAKYKCLQRLKKLFSKNKRSEL